MTSGVSDEDLLSSCSFGVIGASTGFDPGTSALGFRCVGSATFPEASTPYAASLASALVSFTGAGSGPLKLGTPALGFGTSSGVSFSKPVIFPGLSRFSPTTQRPLSSSRVIRSGRVSFNDATKRSAVARSPTTSCITGGGVGAGSTGFASGCFNGPR